MNYRYILEKYKEGGSTRHECPQCGKKKCFTRYVCAETGEYLDERCGKCDHECSCGYHYTPKQYFADHPLLRGKATGSSCNETDRKPLSVSCELSVSTVPRLKSPAPQPLSTLPWHLVERSCSRHSLFVRWLTAILPTENQLQQVCRDYYIGATRESGVIFWQIDEQMRVRTGKIMHYTANGHRTGMLTWTHAILKKQHQLPESWTLTQCLFGEHLLSRSQATVCLVESEKTAVVCAAFYPQFLWLATGGCKQLSVEKLKVLRGRKVVVYPDAGELDDWTRIMSLTQDIAYTMVRDLESFPPNTDIADLLVANAIPWEPETNDDAPF